MMTIKPYAPQFEQGLADLRRYLQDTGYSVSEIEDGQFTADVSAEAWKHVKYVVTCYRCVVAKR